MECEQFQDRCVPVPESGCWLWLGSVSSGGYGQLKIGGKLHRAHRLAWIVFRGPIPAGMMVCHRCDVPLCVNPDHLFVGTARDNFRDCLAKGRAGNWYGLAVARSKQRQSIGTHCRYGHFRTPSSTGRNRYGFLTCLICQRLREQNGI
jgi:hypothetical protein